jgi:stearoyl-CoA desaturase (delta-9 desaturase)
MGAKQGINGKVREAVLIKLKDYNWGAVIPFLLLHIAWMGIFFVPFRWAYLAGAVVTYVVLMFGITAGYHRYFSHRTYKLNRAAQFAMAVLAQTSGQKGVLWWAAHHRDHHRNSDQPEDLHSPWRWGLWWSHVGWVLSNKFDSYNHAGIKDMEKYPELRWLDKHHWVPTTLFGISVYLIGGPRWFFWAYALAIVILYHATFTINSLAHVWGSKRFPTGDESRNNLVLAILTMGEGWHNNHHFCMTSCRQGIKWWEIDVTYYLLKLLSALGIARDLRGFRLPAN